jgi:hypothetical protein
VSDHTSRSATLVARFAEIARASIYAEYQAAARRRSLLPEVAGILQHGVTQPYLTDSVSVQHGVQLLAAAGRVHRHVDGDVPPHCYFLVLVNDGFVAKACAVKHSSVPPQYVGTMLHLDTQQEHHLLHDWRLGYSSESYPGWAALCWSKDEEVADWQSELLDACEAWMAAMDRRRPACRLAHGE